MSTNDLQGKTALVTGAGRGIGAAISRSLIDAGCHVILVGRTAGRLQTIETELRDGGGRASVCAADINDAEWLGQLVEEYKTIDIVVHAAAAFADYGPLGECSDDEIRNVVDTNLTAAIRIAAALLPAMHENNYGRLVFIGSRVASLGGASQVAYAAAKGGLKALVKSLTAETAGTNIAAHLLEPGLIDTERTREAMSDSARQRLAEGTAAGRPGTPEEVATAVRYLLSPEAAFLRGVTLRVDGGMGLGLSSGHRHSS